jgi:hypothetical protein
VATVNSNANAPSASQAAGQPRSADSSSGGTPRAEATMPRPTPP